MAGKHLTEAVSDRLEAGLTPGAHATLRGAGHGPLRAPTTRRRSPTCWRGSGGASGPRRRRAMTTRSRRTGPGAVSAPRPCRRASGRGASSPGQSMTGRDVLLGSAFHFAGSGDGARPGLAAWGRVAHGSFEGAQVSQTGRLRLDGEVLTGTLGADADWGPGARGRRGELERRRRHVRRPGRRQGHAREHSDHGEPLCAVAG